MAFEHREGFGGMFPVRDRKTDKHPNLRGDFMLNGVVYEIAGWNKGDRLSLKISEKRERPKEAAPASTGLDDEIPFN